MNKRKRRIWVLTGIVGVLIGLMVVSARATRSVGPHAAQYKIDRVNQGTSFASSNCAVVVFDASAGKQLVLTNPAVLEDCDSGSRKAFLNNMSIKGSDVYYSSPTVCPSTCPINRSDLIIQFGATCVKIVSGTVCKQYSGTIPVTVWQSGNCPGPWSRKVTDPNGKFFYDGCSNTGYIEFTLDEWGGVRCCKVKYHINLVGSNMPKPQTCVSPCN